MSFSDQFMAACSAAKESRLNCLTHVMVLIYLSERDNGSFPTNLASVVKTSTAAITGILDTLERMGLVERIRRPEDRRSYRVAITTKGLEAVARMLP